MIYTFNINTIFIIDNQLHPWMKIIQAPKKKNKCCEDELSEATPDDHPDEVTVEEKRNSEETESRPSEDTVTEREEDGIEEEDPVSVLRARAEDRMFPGTTWCEGEESLDRINNIANASHF